MVRDDYEEAPKWAREKRKANRAFRRVEKQLVVEDADGKRLADLRVEMLRKWEPLARQ